MKSCKCYLLTVVALTAALTINPALAGKPELNPKMVEQGRYLVRIAGCNDCHTPGYIMNDGNVDDSLWLTGDRFGWRGPWGTTYGANLRLFVANMTEDAWVEAARTLKRRPPMPWYNLNAMKEQDLRAVYQYIRSLGDPGQPAPAYVPPDREPAPPFATFPPPPPAN